MIIISMLYLLVDASNGWTEDRMHLFTLSSCLLYNASQLHYYCVDGEQDEVDLSITMNDLNTVSWVAVASYVYRKNEGWNNRMVKALSIILAC